MAIKKTTGNKTFSVGGGSAAPNDPAVYRIMGNNVLTPTGFNGVRYLPAADFPTETEISLDNPITLLQTTLPDGICVGLNVTTGSIELIANTFPAPQYDILEDSLVQFGGETVSVSAGGAISGGPWTLNIPVNIF